MALKLENEVQQENIIFRSNMYIIESLYIVCCRKICLRYEQARNSMLADEKDKTPLYSILHTNEYDFSKYKNGNSEECRKLRNIAREKIARQNEQLLPYLDGVKLINIPNLKIDRCIEIINLSKRTKGEEITNIIEKEWSVKIDNRLNELSKSDRLPNSIDKDKEDVLIAWLLNEIKYYFHQNENVEEKIRHLKKEMSVLSFDDLDRCKDSTLKDLKVMVDELKKKIDIQTGYRKYKNIKIRE